MYFHFFKFPIRCTGILCQNVSWYTSEICCISWMIDWFEGRKIQITEVFITYTQKPIAIYCDEYW